MKILYIATTADSRNRLDGETIKCRVLREYLKEQEELEIFSVDTDNWKKHIFKLIFLIIYYYLRCDKIIISAANKGANIVLNFFQRIHSKKEIFYFVIGGSLYSDIIKKKWNVKPYKKLKKIYVEANALKESLNSIEIENIEVIRNFRKVSQFQSNYKKTDTIKFVFYGRVIKEKGIEEAIKLVNKLNEIDKIKCTLDIYGQIKEEYLDEIKKIFTDNVKYVSEIKPDTKTEYEKLSNYDVFILPTEFLDEGLPGGLIDAYIAGLAVIVSNWKYAKEYVLDNKNGIIFEYKNFSDMYEKTKKMILENKIIDYKSKSKEISEQYIIDNVLRNIKEKLLEENDLVKTNQYEDKKTERLLCIINKMDAGGAETFLMKIYRSLPLEKYQMDFCVSSSEKSFYDEEIIKLGGRIIHIPKKSKNPIKNFFAIKKVVKDGNYKNVIRIAHHSLANLDLLAAKMGGANKLIFRSSNSNSCGNKLNVFMHKIFKILAIKIPNIKIAPSDVAAIHMFGKKEYEKGNVFLLNNGLPLERFKFDKEKRDEIRKEYELEDKFVIGHVGRFVEQKNHKFLIDIFEKYLKKNSNAVLLLIGDGELKDNILDYIKGKKLENNVLYLGLKNNVNELYNIMDCFVFPSLFEGMPNTVIEAQTNGLNCVVSEKITKNVKITENLCFCSLDNIEEWINNIKESKNREETYIEVKNKGYDIKDVTKYFVKICY